MPAFPRPFTRFLLAALLLLALPELGCAPPKAEIKTPEQVLAELAPHYRTVLPEGSGPFPVVLVLHGATDNAWYSFPETLLNRLAQEGFAAVFIDSYAGRDITGRALRSGRLLPGERAADLLVSLQWVETRPWARKGAVGAIGFSHGAATIMDALVLAPPLRRPTGLSSSPEGGLAPLAAAVLLSPWCADDVMGIELTKAFDEDWNAEVPVLALLPGADKISDEELCAAIFRRHAEKGLPVSVLPLEKAGHAFFQKLDDHGNPQPEYDPALAAAAFDETIRFLRDHLK